MTACVSYASAHGCGVGPAFFDGAGDPRIGDRSGSHAVIEAAKGGAFGVHLAARVEDGPEPLPHALHLTRAPSGVELHAVLGEGVPGHALSGLSGQGAARVMLERMQAGRRRAAAQGRLLRMPYGYLRHPRVAGRHCIDPEAAAVVRRIFELRAEGASWRTIAGELSRGAVPPPPSRSTAGRVRWTARRVAAIGRDQVYAGDVVWGRTTSVEGGKGRRVVAPDHWIVSHRPDLAIVDRGTWRKAAQSHRRDGRG